jgi:hypothetical protein
MREIEVGSFDPITGYTTFAFENMQTVTGIRLLVAKIAKKVMSKTFATSIFTYYGLDLESIPYYSIADKDVDTIKTMLSAGLQNILASIQENTYKKAANTERLAGLTLQDLLYDSTTNKLNIQILIIPVEGDSQALLFPLDV